MWGYASFPLFILIPIIILVLVLLFAFIFIFTFSSSVCLLPFRRVPHEDIIYYRRFVKMSHRMPFSRSESAICFAQWYLWDMVDHRGGNPGDESPDSIAYRLRKAQRLEACYDKEALCDPTEEMAHGCVRRPTIIAVCLYRGKKLSSDMNERYSSVTSAFE